MAKDKKKQKKSSMSMADMADRHILYQESVQDVEGEIDFVEQTFEEIRNRPMKILREDFCGTMNTSCEWIRRGDDHEAVCVDNDEEVLAWGRSNNIGALKEQQQARLDVHCDDVFEVSTKPVDAVLAMNFSYFIFEERTKLREYFKRVREALTDDGILFLDIFGGYEAYQELEEPRECDGFDYIWDQADFDPMSGHMVCHIHFEFEDGSRMENAFTYEWRLWSLPEIRELLDEAGYSKVTVYLEGDDEDTGEGNGIFEPATRADADAGFLGYLVAEK
ncbi:MAG: class I SAM-dependent methyltransferase [Gammaproteobacteria bacterium]|nr:class I SAM-dependent methyltransferase [Gammaproteobacteria bacterium]